MRKIVLIGLLSLSICYQGRGAPAGVSSPDGKIRFTLERQAGRVTYRVSIDGRDVLRESPLGLVPHHGPGWSPLSGVLSSATEVVDSTYTPVYGTRARVRDNYNRLQVELGQPDPQGPSLGMDIRAYNDGVAFRYRVHGASMQVELNNELTGFRLVEDATAFAQVSERNRYYEYENGYKTGPLSSLHRTTINLPVTLQLSGNIWMSIAEAHLEDYAGLYVQPATSEANLLTARLFKAGGKPSVVRQTPFETPWRVVMLARRAADLLESNLVYNCNPPCAIADPSWIKPGKVSWEWWSGHMANGVDFDPGMNTATMKHFAKFASDAGLEYFLIDDGWSYTVKHVTPEGREYYEVDQVRSCPEIDMPEILDYCKKLNVKVILWVNSAFFKDQKEKALEAYEKWGVAGIKVDYMSGDSQAMVNWYREVVELAAKHHLLVNFHGCYKPTGECRTWPNQITQEGVKGLESSGAPDGAEPDHNVILPFTRNLAGPMDYTPGGFDCRTQKDFKAYGGTAIARGTRAHQIAQYVVYYSPMQMLSDYPERYVSAPGFEFLKQVPTAWDETRALAGRPDEYVAVARERGGVWYLGCINNWQSRTLELPLSFLGSGNWEADLYTDGSRAENDANHIRIEKRDFSAADTLTVKLASGGGCAARFTRVP